MRRLRDPELLRVQLHDLRGVPRRVVCGYRFGMVGCLGGEFAGEFAEGGFCF